MKRTLLFMACVLASIMMHAQEKSNDYLPFVEIGKQWYVSVLCNFVMYEEVERDGKTYAHTYYVDETWCMGEEVGLFREENRRVYMYDKTAGRDIMLYDFSLNEGDTFTYEYGFDQPVNCKVLKQGWLDDGPEIVTSCTSTSDGTLDINYRHLRTWTIGCDNGAGGYDEIATWVECVGALEDMFPPVTCDYWKKILGCVKRKDNETGYDKNEYLPFTLCNIFLVDSNIYGCNLPKGAEYQMEDWHHDLTYELEGDRLHVSGKAVLNCGSYNYAWFVDEPTDDPSVHKLFLQIQEVGPSAYCYSLFATDFYVSGFDPNINYIVIDNKGEKFPVISKTQQMAYRPFVEDGKVWVVKGRGISPDGSPMEPWIDYCYLDGDTIIGGQTCKRMMCVTETDRSQQYIGAWYEQDKKVYFASNGKQQFELFYDFTLSSNDYINEGDFMFVVTRMSGGITGFKGTYYDVRNNDGNVTERWFEGVGSDSWPYVNHPLYYDGDVGGVLLECSVGDEVIYYNSEEEDPYSMGARKRRFDFTHTIKTKPQSRMRSGAEESMYGEYNDQQLCINFDPLDDAYLVCITDESGKVVYEKNINAGDIVGLSIDISDYAEGRYTITIDNSNEIFTGEFEAQTTGIEEIKCNMSEVRGHIYNLQGQRLNTLQKGLNIVNGQKVYVK